jgi:predicted DNA-binding transcriptional regulator AlpA
MHNDETPGRQPTKTYVRTKEAREDVLGGVSRSWFWRVTRDDPDAPKPYRLNGVCLWKVEELVKWIESK